MSLLKRVLRRILSTCPTGRRSLFFRVKRRQRGFIFVQMDPYFDLERGVKILRLGASHAIYIPHMIESFDYYWNSVVPVQDVDRQIVDMSGPRHHELIGFGDMPFLFPSHTE